MKINEVLNKVTLKLPGGGKFPLSKYAPYITNVDEDVEGLTGGNNILYAENIIYPEIFITLDYFESEKEILEDINETFEQGDNFYSKEDYENMGLLD